jgi:hypothetical protein
MAETVTNRRRIDRLKALAIKQGFTNEDAKQFGKLSKTATWEALLETYSIPLHPVDTFDSTFDSKAQSLDTSDWTNDASFPLCNFTPQNSTNFLALHNSGMLSIARPQETNIFQLVIGTVLCFK